MKKLEFETSKGEFLLMDMKHNSYFQNTELPKGYTTVNFIKLSQITEEQASEVVGLPISNIAIYNKLSLHEPLESKGVHLFENPYKDVGLIPSHEQKLYREAEEKTFYNPYLFKRSYPELEFKCHMKIDYAKCYEVAKMRPEGSYKLNNSSEVTKE